MKERWKFLLNLLKMNLNKRVKIFLLQEQKLLPNVFVFYNDLGYNDESKEVYVNFHKTQRFNQTQFNLLDKLNQLDQIKFKNIMNDPELDDLLGKKWLIKKNTKYSQGKLREHSLGSKESSKSRSSKPRGKGIILKHLKIHKAIEKKSSSGENLKQKSNSNLNDFTPTTLSKQYDAFNRSNELILKQSKQGQNKKDQEDFYLQNLLLEEDDNQNFIRELGTSPKDQSKQQLHNNELSGWDDEDDFQNQLGSKILKKQKKQKASTRMARQPSKKLISSPRASFEMKESFNKTQTKSQENINLNVQKYQKRHHNILVKSKHLSIYEQLEVKQNSSLVKDPYDYIGENSVCNNVLPYYLMYGNMNKTQMGTMKQRRNLVLARQMQQMVKVYSRVQRQNMSQLSLCGQATQLYNQKRKLSNLQNKMPQMEPLKQNNYDFDH